jgi:phosphotriesterase-related protein
MRTSIRETRTRCSKRKSGLDIDRLDADDEQLAIEELRRFREAGGRSAIDHATRWIGGDPEALRRISEATDVHIVAGCGFYSPMLPDDIDRLSVGQLEESIVREVSEGIDGTTIKPGFIGEIGTNWPITPQEEKIVRAAARAQARTGLALSIHAFPWERAGLILLDIAKSEGADLSRVVICHLDHTMDLDYHKKVARRGAYVEYDRFGVEWYSSQETLRTFPRDTERVAGLKELIQSGFAQHLLISQDVCQKIELKKFGGHGYAHILRYTVPMMKRMGISDEHIHTILVENPRRMLHLVLGPLAANL